MIEPLLRKLRARDEVSPDEEKVLRDALGQAEEVPAYKTVVRRAEPLQRSILLLEGYMCRYKDLRNGRRQITALHVPGDFLDLHGFTLQKLDHDVMSLSPCRIVSTPHRELVHITERYPHLTRLLWFTTNLDAAMHREWELSLGQRTGAARAAHLLCELHARLEVVGLIRGNAFDMPLKQAELGECLGLTVVHTNRVLRELRVRGLVQITRGQVQIEDMEGLKSFAEFDPTYLYLEKSPR
jgi:CRP-like cAMP-binding protein